jgi:hypothetical protein
MITKAKPHDMSLHKNILPPFNKKPNLVPDMIHPITTNLNIHMSRFVILKYVTSDRRFVYLWDERSIPQTRSGTRSSLDGFNKVVLS